MPPAVHRVNWRRTVASGAVWTLAYNLIWGIGWFAFMRREWQVAVTAIGHPMPWTGAVWFLWGVLTVPIGIALMAYSASRAPRETAAALTAAVAIWLVLALSMAAYSLSQALSIRVIVLDASVNLVAMVTAALAGAWSQREA